MKTMKQLADDAIHVQDACNLIAVANSFASVTKEVRDRLAESCQECGTDAIRNHPIVQLWASKIIEMCGMGYPDMDKFSEVYFAVEHMAYHATETK